MYTVDNKGWIVPAFIRKQPTGGRGEETWFTLLTAYNYVKGVPSILDLVPPQAANQHRVSPLGPPLKPARPTVSSDVPVVKIAPFPSPAIPTPPASSTGVTHGLGAAEGLIFNGVASGQGVSKMIDCWYAGNFILVSHTFANEAANIHKQDAFPMRVIQHNRNPDRIYGGPLTKASQIRKSSEMAMIFDGFECHDYETNNIALRHSKGKVCNFLFADGHAQSVTASPKNDGTVDTKGLPNGHTITNSDLRSAATLVDCPFPKWRLDQ